MSLAAYVLSLVMLAGGGSQVPRVEITPILHTGDPAPGVPGATMTYFLPPQIDGAGNVLVDAFYSMDDGTSGGNGLWYGPPGALQLISYAGMQAPDLAPGVVIDFMGDTWLAENGWIGFSAQLSGPGVVSGVNDIANFIGPPGDIRKVLRGRDPAPGLEPGTLIDVSSGNGLTPWLSDNATLLVIAWLAGPQVDEANDQAIWIGRRDDLQLIWRKGMEAPGTNGARFAWADLLKFNDNAQIAFRGGLVNAGGIDSTNDGGQWSGPPGGLELVAREGDQAWGLPEGVLYGGSGGAPAFNVQGDVSFGMLLRGKGVGPENDTAQWLRTSGGMQLVGREGDPVPELGPNSELDEILSSASLNAHQEILYRVKYSGTEIDGSNAWALYFGASDDAEQTLRDGDPAPQISRGAVFSRVASAPALAALNDLGDLVTGTEISGPLVPEHEKVVVWLQDHVRQTWFSLLRAGAEVNEGTVLLASESDLTSAYWNKTGGSDGQRQSFNDARQLAIKLEFLDGTHGTFVLQPLWDGDHDDDADVDLLDLAGFQACYTGPGVAFLSGCRAFDFDDDEDVDLLDYERFLDAVTGPG